MPTKEFKVIRPWSITTCTGVNQHSLRAFSFPVVHVEGFEPRACDNMNEAMRVVAAYATCPRNEEVAHGVPGAIIEVHTETVSPPAPGLFARFMNWLTHG